MKLIERILSVFHKNYPLEKRDAVWNNCMEKAMQSELNEANLENMYETNLIYGFGNRTGGMEEVVALAKAVGVCGIDNPENNAFFGHYVSPPVNLEHLSLKEILDKIQEKLSFRIEFPTFTGNCSRDLQTEQYGVLTDRYIHYLWVLDRVMELCPDRNSSIIEVGAGFGVLGYYLDKAGYRDYTTVDLALVNACQTYFLAKNLPNRDIILSGDVPDPFDPQHKYEIKLLHANDFCNVPSRRFDIMVNIDGLTEYGIEQASKYVQSDCADMLLSINHEMNPFRVCDIEQSHRKRAYRYPFWLRDGYVEELYRST